MWLTFIDDSSSSLLLESIDGIIYSLGRSRSGSVGYQDQIFRLKMGQNQFRPYSESHDDQRMSGITAIIKLLWGLFLKSFRQESHRSTERWRSYLQESRQLGIEYLLQLAKFSLTSPRRHVLSLEKMYSFEENENLNGSDMTLYCIIIQEVLNAIVDHSSFGEDYINLEVISCLMELIYRSDDQLCSTFWSYWRPSNQHGKISEQNFPICRFLKFLYETTFYEPRHLIRILLAISCSKSAVSEVVSLLSCPVSITSWTSFDSIKIGSSRALDGSINWINGRDWLVSSNSRSQVLQKPVLYEPNSAPHKDDISNFVEPSKSTAGIILHRESDKLLVKWQCESNWFALVFGTVNAVLSLGDTSPVSCPLLVADVLSLLSKIFQLHPHPLTTIAADWDRLCLYSFLRLADVLEAYPIMCEQKKTIGDIHCDPMTCWELLQDAGINRNQLSSIFEASKFCQFPSFENFLIEGTIKLMISVLSLLSSHANSGNLDCWREILACSLSLLNSLVQLSLSPSYTIHILQSIATMNEIEHWVGLLSCVAEIEGEMGSYDVTWQISELFSSMLTKLLTPVPLQLDGLEAVFHQFDLDGNGRISSGELHKSLVNMGYEVTMTEVDSFYQHIDEENSSAIHISTLLRYATSEYPSTNTQVSLLSEALGTFSNVDRAKEGLSRLLQDVINPGSLASSYLGGHLTVSATKYCLDCLTQINRWNFQSVAQHSLLTLSCIKILSIILNTASPSTPDIIRTPAFINASNYFFNRFIEDKQLLDILVNSCLNLGLTALQHAFTSSPRESRRSLKSFIFEPTKILPGADSGGLQPSILPVNYLGGADRRNNVHIDLLEEITLQVIYLFNLILDLSNQDNMTTNPQYQKCASLFLESMFETASTSGSGYFGISRMHPLLTAHSSSAITSVDLPCQNLAVLVSLLDYPSSPLLPIIGHSTKIPIAAIQLLTKVTCTLKLCNDNHLIDRRSLIDGLGYQNIEPFCRTICSWMVSKSNAGLKFASLDFLSALCHTEPLVIVLLMKVSSSDTLAGSKLAISSEASLLSQTIEKLLQKAEYLNDRHPILLAKLYELILGFLEKSHHRSIGQFILNLAKLPSFWESVTVPLMHDVTPPPSPELGDTLDASNYLHGFDLSMKYERDGVIPDYCGRLLCHALALRILSRERFGTMFFIDSSDLMLDTKSSDKDQLHQVAERIEKNVDLFFERANNSHRFLSWVKHYMKVDIDYSFHKQTELTAKTVGFNLASLLAKPRHSRNGFSCYGGCYIYSFQLVKKMFGTVDSHTSEWRSWNALLNHIVHLNCMWSVADSQVIKLFPISGCYR